MHENLITLYRACEPDKAAAPEYWTDCSKGRGGNILLDEILPRIQYAGETDYVRVLFTGHRGGGKSSELKHLANTLTQEVDSSGTFLPIYIDADDYFARNDANLTDIYLPLVSEIAAAFQAFGIKLTDTYFESRFREIKDFFLTDIEVKEGEFTLGLYKGKINRLRDSSEARDKVREALRRQSSTILTQLNLFLDEARRELRKLKQSGGAPVYKNFLLIMDNMEKIQEVRGFREGEESLKAFFVENAQIFSTIKSHAVFTIPLQIARSHGPELANEYALPPLVLPVVKVCERDGETKFADGFSCLREILTRRLSGTSCDSVIDEDALDFLIGFSGGHIRYFIRFLHNAAARAQGEKIDMAAAERAINGDYTTFDAAVRTEWIDQLLAIVQDEYHHADTQNVEILQMLELSVLLEYYNSGKNLGRIQRGSYWYAPHPLVAELNRYIRRKEEVVIAAETAIATS